MTDPAFPHVPEKQLEIIAKYQEFFQNTGGNDPREMLEKLATDQNLMRHNEVYAMLALAVSSQVMLLLRLEDRGMLGEALA